MCWNVDWGLKRVGRGYGRHLLVSTLRKGDEIFTASRTHSDIGQIPCRDSCILVCTHSTLSQNDVETVCFANDENGARDTESLTDFVPPQVFFTIVDIVLIVRVLRVIGYFDKLQNSWMRHSPHSPHLHLFC